jgi:hypothetical protein
MRDDLILGAIGLAFAGLVVGFIYLITLIPQPCCVKSHIVTKQECDSFNFGFYISTSCHPVSETVCDQYGECKK